MADCPHPSTRPQSYNDLSEPTSGLQVWEPGDRPLITGGGGGGGLQNGRGGENKSSLTSTKKGWGAAGKVVAMHAEGAPQQVLTWVLEILAILKGWGLKSVQPFEKG